MTRSFARFFVPATLVLLFAPLLPRAAAAAVNAPTNLRLDNLWSIRGDVRWNDNATNETGYRVALSTDNVNWDNVAVTGANVVVQRIEDLLPETTYFCKVRAYRIITGGTEYSNYSNTLTLTTRPLEPPTTLRADAIQLTSVVLHWNDNSSSESGYRIARSTDGVNYDHVGTVGPGGTTWTATNLPPRQTCWFKVRAYVDVTRGTGYSAYSNILAVTTVDLAAPDNLHPTGGSSTAVDLNWNDHATGESGYRVAVSENGVDYNHVATTGPDVQSATVGGLVPGRFYWFLVRAYSDQFGAPIYSAYSAPAQIQTLVAPDRLAASEVVPTGAILTWRDNSGAEAGYRVARSLDGVNYDHLLTTGPNADLVFVDGLAPGTTCWFKVRAFGNPAGGTIYSDYGGPLQITTPQLVAPHDLCATPGGTAVTLTWGDDNGYHPDLTYRVAISVDGVNFDHRQDSFLTEATLDDLTPGRHYWFKVRASLSSTTPPQYSGYSNVAALVTPRWDLCPAPATDGSAGVDRPEEKQSDWCATERLPHGAAAAQALGGCATGDCDDPAVRDATVVTPADIGLVVHVMRQQDGTGGVDQATVDASVARLNADFLAAGFRFASVATRYHDTARYACLDFFDFATLSQMKNEFAESPGQYLNVFISCMQDGPDGSSLRGFGTFPWDPGALTAQGGIWLNTLGMGAAQTTLSHEVGHCLGLFHTFHGVAEVDGNACVACGSACTEFASGYQSDLRGDFCADTRATPRNYSCADPIGVDCAGTCWGGTPTDNLMGYSPCRARFTNQQRSRMHCWTRARLAGWLAAASGVAEAGTSGGRFTLDVMTSAAAGVGIVYSLPEAGVVEVELFDVAGRRVATLANGTQSAGRHDLTWPGRAMQSGRTAAGIYFVQVRHAGRSLERKLILR